VRASRALCDSDFQWLSEVASTLKALDERAAHAFAFKYIVQRLLNSSSSSTDKDAASQFFEQNSASCLLQLSKSSNSERLVFETPHSSISTDRLVEALSFELQMRYPVFLSKTTFASKIDDIHIGVFYISQSFDTITVDALVLPAQDLVDANDPYIGEVPPNLLALLYADEGERTGTVPDVLLPSLKDWLRSVISLCERTLSNIAFRCAHQSACLAPHTIDSAGMLKVLGLAQCISIDITFADLLSVNEKTATSLFGSVSLFQSLSPEHIQRVEHAIADAISDHRATDAMLSFCSATSANGVYAMNIKQQPSFMLSRRGSLISSNVSISVDTAAVDDTHFAMSPSSSNFTGPPDATDSCSGLAVGTSVEAANHPHHPIISPVENDLMFVRIGQLTPDGKLFIFSSQFVVFCFC
jgi:hypothetical protein